MIIICTCSVRVPLPCPCCSPRPGCAGSCSRTSAAWCPPCPRRGRAAAGPRSPAPAPPAPARQPGVPSPPGTCSSPPAANWSVARYSNNTGHRVQPPPVLQHQVLLHEPPVCQVAATEDAGVAPGEHEHCRRGLGDEAAVLADQQRAVPASVLATAASQHLGQLGAQGQARVSRMSP